MSFKNHKIAFVFPGQGSQYLGMSMDFIERDNDLYNTLEAFRKRTGTDLLSIMKDGPEDILKETRFTQPAILFHSYAAMKSLLQKINISPDFVAGHSLGEFTALVANGVLDIEDAMYLVHRRGEFMIKANDGRPFAMSAIMGPSSDEVRSFCQEASETGIVVAANFNTPVQTVISGEEQAVRKAEDIARANGAKRIFPLAVGGAFHSPLIEKAAEWLEKEMNSVSFNNTKTPVISNVDALPAKDPEVIKRNLKKQITSSVLWVKSVQNMVEQGTTLFLEFGPQKVIAGMIKKIDKNVEVISIDNIKDLEDATAKLNEM
ncbi:MAG: ACP S-malonyltransferase [Candidatus Cloacimonetes bacterium]|nr:ACP S-malonyltransferase [Candidatus Cloacimonadota bacterium]